MKENVFLIDDYYFSSSLLFILIYHHRIVFLLFHKLWTNTFSGFGILVVGLNLSEKKQKERKVALVVVPTVRSRSSKTATRTKKRRPTTSHILFKADPPLTHYYCIIVFTVGICLRTDRYLKEYSIEREIWSIEEERTNAREKSKRRGDVSGHIFGW